MRSVFLRAPCQCYQKSAGFAEKDAFQDSGNGRAETGVRSGRGTKIKTYMSFTMMFRIQSANTQKIRCSDTLLRMKVEMRFEGRQSKEEITY